MGYRERMERSRKSKSETISGPEFKVFHGVGVVIAEIKSDSLHSVTGALIDDAYVDYSRIDLRFSVDMTRTPGRVGKKEWDKIQIDDRGIDEEGRELPLDPQAMKFPLAITSIGSGSLDDPMRGAYMGAVYLERSYFLSIRNTKLNGWPDVPGDYSLVEVTSIAYSGKPDALGRRNKRYHGFSATVTAVQGDEVTVEIVERGTAKSLTFRTGDAGAYDPAPPGDALGGQPSLVLDLSVGQSGALFVELKTAVNAMLVGPKLPISEGD